MQNIHRFSFPTFWFFFEIFPTWLLKGSATMSKLRQVERKKWGYVVRSFLAYLQRAYIHKTVILLFLTLSNIRININLRDLLTDNYGKNSGKPLFVFTVLSPSGAFWVICIGFQWKKS